MQIGFQYGGVVHVSFLIGNHGSAFLEIKVGRSVDGDFVNLLPSVTMMSPSDSKLGFHKTGKRQFGSGDLSKSALKSKWDRVRIICRQPFKPADPFGLSFLSFYTTDCTSPDFKREYSSPHKPSSLVSNQSSTVFHEQEAKSMKPNRQSVISPKSRLPSLKSAAFLPSSDNQKTTGKSGPKRKRLGTTGDTHLNDNEDGIAMRSKIVKQRIERQEQEARKPKSVFEAVNKALNDAVALDMMKDEGGCAKMCNTELKGGDDCFTENLLSNQVEAFEMKKAMGTKSEVKCDEKQCVTSFGCYQRRSFLGPNGMTCRTDKKTVNFAESYSEGKTDKEALHRILAQAKSRELHRERMRERYAMLDEIKQSTSISSKQRKLSQQTRKEKHGRNNKTFQKQTLGTGTKDMKSSYHIPSTERTSLTCLTLKS
jgi:hypothetical protein